MKKKFTKDDECICNGLSVTVGKGSIEYALRKFKRKVKFSGLMVDIQKKSFFEKPSAKLRRAKNLAKLRNKYTVVEEEINLKWK